MLAERAVANLMFARAAITNLDEGPGHAGHFLAEIIAMFGLILVIFALARSGRSQAAPAAVGAYIGAAYVFTSSTSFANPAITVGRMFSDTSSGIAPASVPAFISAQLVGGALAVAAIRALCPGLGAAAAAEITVPLRPRPEPEQERHQHG